MYWSAELQTKGSTGRVNSLAHLKGLCQLVILRTGVISWRYICQNSIVSRRNTIRNRTREHVQALRDMIITITCR